MSAEGFLRKQTNNKQTNNKQTNKQQTQWSGLVDRRQVTNQFQPINFIRCSPFNGSSFTRGTIKWCCSGNLRAGVDVWREVCPSGSAMLEDSALPLSSSTFTMTEQGRYQLTKEQHLTGCCSHIRNNFCTHSCSLSCRLCLNGSCDRRRRGGGG